MTLEEFSNEFDILIDSYKRFKKFDELEILDSLEFSEYEKSIFLTNAQELIVIELYSGKNPLGESFEKNEELRRELNSLIINKIYAEGLSLWKFGDNFPILFGSGSQGSLIKGGIQDNWFKHYLCNLEKDCLYLVYEQVLLKDRFNSIVNVTPALLDSFTKMKLNPFRQPSNSRVLRIDGNNTNTKSSQTIELVSKYEISNYTIKYLSKPTPIVLVNLGNLSIDDISEPTECILNPILHRRILDRAILLALQSKSIKSNGLSD